MSPPKLIIPSSKGSSSRDISNVPPGANSEAQASVANDKIQGTSTGRQNAQPQQHQAPVATDKIQGKSTGRQNAQPQQQQAPAAAQQIQGTSSGPQSNQGKQQQAATQSDNQNATFSIHSDTLKVSDADRTQLVLICPPPHQTPHHLNLNNVKVVKEYSWRVPERCETARKANEEGKSPTLMKLRHPTVPHKKYSDAQYDAKGPAGSWSVQSVYQISDQPVKYLVTYEGYRSAFEQPGEDVEKSAPEAVELYRQWRSFMEMLSVNGSAEQRTAAQNQLELLSKNGVSLVANQNSLFWTLQDLSYFHTVHQKENGLAAVFYLDLQESNIPPEFEYTAVNIAKLSTVKWMLLHKYNRSIDQLRNLRSSKPVPVQTGASTGCENKGKCICDEVYHHLYSSKRAHNLKPNQHGFLDLTNFDSLSDYRVLVECSNRCGCSLNCPRRRLQKGQQKPLAITYEGKTGFGVRAMTDYVAGEYVCDYTGTYFRDVSKTKCSKTQSKKMKTDDVGPKNKDTSYEIDFEVIHPGLVICAKDAGNVGRFINHSCDPNAFLLEVHSRALEENLMAPKIGVFTWKPIKRGEEVFLSYIGDITRIVVQTPGIPCECGSVNCLGTMPMKWYTT